MILPRTHKHAFSLIELSIVLVILGLLTGGILAGQSLIRAAELRSVSNDFARYMTAVHSFRDKYFALPGDMTNATRFWNPLGGDGSNAACQNLAATGAPTCNGNGDGRILTSVVNYDERFRSWQHLANAGLIEGTYNGNETATTGIRNPRSRIGTAYYDLVYETPNVNLYAPGTRTEVNTIALYDMGSTGPLVPEEAWNIDTKLDDGSPVYGAVWANKRTSLVAPNCASSDIDTATYDLQAKSKYCVLHYGMR
jgi:prepilin-type N-terminal cleavage/methylation domain-containing protein